MRRREFITLVDDASHAQQPAIRCPDFLDGASADTRALFLRAFHQGLSEGGFVERRTPHSPG